MTNFEYYKTKEAAEEAYHKMVHDTGWENNNPTMVDGLYQEFEPDNSKEIYCKPYVVLWRLSSRHKWQLNGIENYNLFNAVNYVKSMKPGYGQFKIMKLVDIDDKEK